MAAMQFIEISKIPFVSVVICTYNRKRLLKECLTSILATDYPRSRYEIIIVDGGSNDGTEDLCKEFADIRFVTERRFGLAHARNRGAELSVGSIVAYTDDDCIVEKSWLKTLVLGFRYYPSFAGVGGPVFPLHPDIVPKTILVAAALGLFYEGDRVRMVEGLITSNVAFKKKLFNSVKFDEALGTTRRGKLILCNEDTKFCNDLKKAGYKLLYTPYARVYHQIDNNRLRVSYIVRRATHRGLSNAKSLEIENGFRVWMIRVAVGHLFQSLLAVRHDRSFSSCYKIIVAMSTLFVCLTGLEKVLVAPP